MSNPMPPQEAPEPANDTGMLWSDERLLGFAPMDRTHEEFYDVSRRLMFSGEEGLVAALDAFIAHAEAHFGQEADWMRSTEFPGRDCHLDEHAAVLKSAYEVRDLVREGRAGVALVRNFASHLFAWFPGHADYLDSALAAWMSKRSYGGTPVVVRRKGR